MTSIETSGTRPQAEFGFDDVRAIPLAAIINLRQMRETVDPDELEKLKGRIPYHMDEDGVLRFDLTHPIMVNVLDRESLEQYVVDHDEYYQEPSGINLDTLPNLDGLYLFVRIVGHMRGAGSARELHGARRGPPRGSDQCQPQIRLAVYRGQSSAKYREYPRDYPPC